MTHKQWTGLLLLLPACMRLPPPAEGGLLFLSGIHLESWPHKPLSKSCLKYYSIGFCD
jgi:hypothetical protein